MEYASIVLQNEYRQTAWTSPSYNGNMSFLPYPPPPEPGWYDDDVTVMAQPTAEPVDNAADSLETRERLAAQNESDDHDMQDVSVAKGDAAVSDEDDIDWDGTVLSEAFTMKQPKHTYVLDNEQTGQQVIVDMGVLLGRKPSAEVPAGAKSVKLEDPTRTISRNHAAISFDQDGTLRITVRSTARTSSKTMSKPKWNTSRCSWRRHARCVSATSSSNSANSEGVCQ